MPEKIRKLLDRLTPSNPIKTDGDGKQYIVLKDRNNTPVRVSGKGLKLGDVEQGDIPAEGEERSPHEVSKTEVHFDISKRQQRIAAYSAISLGVNANLGTAAELLTAGIVSWHWLF